MAICIYPPYAEDFTTNGLGTLTPLECTVEEVAAGKYELELVHPIDNTLRWAQITNGCILKVPAPVRESPLYEAPAMGEPVTVTRQVWVVSGTTHGLYIRTGPGMGYKRIGVKKNGVEVLELEDAADPWKKVCVLSNGQVGYMSTKYLRPLRTETEVIEPAKPTGGSVLKLGQSREQFFRIYSVEQDSEAATVTAKALHVFYDENGNLIDADYEIAEGKTEEVNAVMANINSKLAVPRSVAFQAINLTGDITGDFSYKTPVEAYLDPDEGIVAQTKALLVRDNWDAFLLPDMVRDRGVTIRRGKNLIGVEVTNDASGIVTRIIPVGKNKNGDPLYLTDTKYVDSPHIGDYPFPRIKRIEYDVQTGKDGFNNDAAVRNEIKRLAEEDFSKNGVDLPKYGMDVDFVLLQNTAEYEDYASLQAVHLYDTVTVIDEMLGLKAKVRVTGYKWNCLNEQYESVTLGELQEVNQTVYSYNLPNAGISGTKIMNNSLGGSALRNATIEYAKIAVAAIQQLTADSITALTARIQELVAGSITTDELYAGIADITKATVEEADIDWASINELNAAIATLVKANIGTADIDFARIKDMVTDTAIITEGVGGQLFISRLAVTEANIVSLTTGELVVKGEDGRFYSLSVDADGNVITTLKQLNNDDVQDSSLNAGEKLIEGSVTAACLNAREIFADNALIRQLIAANLDVDALFAREAFVNLLRTGKIVGDKSIEMIAGETDELRRRSGIEVIEGTFARTERRAGEGIHVFSEFGPKQTGSGTPSPDNIRPIEGRTGLQAVCCGRNLLPDLGKEQTAYGITFAKNADGGWRIRGTATAAAIFSFAVAGDKMWIPSGRYAVSLGTALPNGVTSRVEAYYKDTLKWFKTYGNIPSESGKYTIDILGDYYTTWLVSISSGTTVDFVIRPMIQLASDTDSAFDSFAARYALQFGETVYGGSVDWAAGEMTVTWKGMKLLSSWVTSSMRYVPGFVGAWMDKVLNDDYSEGQETILCSHLIGRAVYNRSRDGVYVEGENTIGIQFNGASIPNYTDTGNADQNAGLIKAYLDANDVWVAWKLKNPCPIRLTPAVIASLNGINTVYTDADDGRIEFGHELPDICDSILPPASPEAGAFWLDRSVTPCVLRRYTGSDWETVNDVTTIESVQDALLNKQAELEAARRETALFLKLDSANKVVRIGQSGVTSEYRIDAFGSGVVVNNEIFSRFEADRVLFGNMEMRMPGVGGLAFDSIAR